MVRMQLVQTETPATFWIFGFMTRLVLCTDLGTLLAETGPLPQSLHLAISVTYAKIVDVLTDDTRLAGHGQAS